VSVIANNSIKVLVVEARNLLREKLAGILSREEGTSMVIQVSSYSNLQTALGETVPDLVFGDFFEFNKFCKETGTSAGELCPDATILLYMNEYEQSHRVEVEHLGDPRVFNVLNIHQEVRRFLEYAKQRKQSKE
jgi:hypothetical protein